jgi:hypothetical protein
MSRSALSDSPFTVPGQNMFQKLGLNLSSHRSWPGLDTKSSSASICPLIMAMASALITPSHTFPRGA